MFPLIIFFVKILLAKLFKLRGGASRTSHVGRSVGLSVRRSVGRSLENFDIF